MKRNHTIKPARAVRNLLQDLPLTKQLIIIEMIAIDLTADIADRDKAWSDEAAEDLCLG